MILSMILVPLVFVFLAVVTVANPAASEPRPIFTDHMGVDEPRILDPEVVAKVNKNWLRDVKESTGKEYEKNYGKFVVNISSSFY